MSINSTDHIDMMHHQPQELTNFGETQDQPSPASIIDSDDEDFT